ncbi:MAG: Flp pilus assembly complex ATPase component TadA, partial [Bacilli bacterium]|nr:Flp pilus assembly complex ATPase component TadA [Bacilli bacterium]
MMVQYDVKRVTKGAENFMVSFDFAKTPITQVADYIIIAAQKNKTSDIHFDPRDEGMMVRFRIDGDCQDYTFIPKAYERNLTTRLKLLANMNITETRLPQDGAIKGQFGDTYMDMRVACLPTNQGEKIVIRILDYTRSLQGIDSLGFHPKNLEKIHHMMGVPNGIILVTGATGSGKSTTTYSMLSALNKPEINVITVEDPVEMNIEGINQVQVNAEIGMTFAAALRSILREDPNVILIGEIRDSETAQIAVRASITGHLVMSTLHTNNALATVERLLDMDVERYLLSTALTGIISQRLAKQLCQDCKIQREPTKYEKKVYKKFLHEDVKMVWDANPKGCENCRKGYKGRIAVHEVLLLDDKIRNALNNENMSKDDFAKMIYGGNTISMLQDALIKSLEGQTSFEEVYKTIEIENEDEDNYAEELEGVTITNTAEEEQQEEIKTAEDDMGEEQETTSTLTEKYEIPGVTTNQQQPETPVQEETTNEQTETTEQEFEMPQVNETPAEEEQVTNEPTEVEVPNYQTEEQPVEEQQVTNEPTEVEVPNYQTEEQPAEEQQVENETTEVEVPNYQTEEQTTEELQEQPETTVEETPNETISEETPTEQS